MLKMSGMMAVARASRSQGFNNFGSLTGGYDNQLYGFMVMMLATEGGCPTQQSTQKSDDAER